MLDHELHTLHEHLRIVSACEYLEQRVRGEKEGGNITHHPSPVTHLLLKLSRGLEVEGTRTDRAHTGPKDQ